MEYHPFGCTDPEVNALCLGTMTWDEQDNEQDVFTQIARARAAGIDFMDAVEVYPAPPHAKTYASTERIIGNQFRRSGDRADWTSASKVAGPGNGINHMHDSNLKFNRQYIVTAPDASLERLQAGRLDLYQSHWPRRRINFFGQFGYRHQERSSVSLGKTLKMLDEQVHAGKVRHIGLFNEAPWGTMIFLRFAEERGWPRAVSIQNPHNLLDRSFKAGLAEIAIREQCGLLAYSPMAFGMFSGKYADGAHPANARVSLYSRFTHYTSPQTETAYARYIALARGHGLEPAQMALAYVTLRPFMTNSIIGAISLEQLEANLGNVNLKLDGEVFTGIDAIHREQPNPAP